jgi:hypothetical protein
MGGVRGGWLLNGCHGFKMKRKNEMRGRPGDDQMNLVVWKFRSRFFHISRCRDV